MGGGGNHSHKFSLTYENLKPYFLCFLSIFCIHWGIASYQPFIDTALILLCGGIIAIIIDNNGDLKVSLYKSRFIIIAVALGAISYKIVLDIFKKINITTEWYSNKMIPLAEIPERVRMAIEFGFKHIFTYSEPFMPLSMSICFVIFVALLFVLLKNVKIVKSAKCAIIILFLAMIVFSQMHIILANNIATALYVEYYGLLFLRVLIVMLVFKCIAQFIRTQALLQSFAFALSCVFIWICVVQDLQIQKIQKLTMERDFRFLNRLINRIEQSEGFSYNKKYCGIVFGNIKTTNDFLGLNLFFLSMDGAFRYTMPKDIFADCNIFGDEYMQMDNKTFERFQSFISRLHKAGILDKLEPFPHKNSVVVFEDIIVFVASKGNLDEIKEMAKKLG